MLYSGCERAMAESEDIFPLGLSSFPKDSAHFSEADAILELVPSKNYLHFFARSP